MITSLIAAAIVNGAAPALTISVEGEGYLRFVKKGKDFYAGNAEVFPTASGLSTADGALLVPRIVVPKKASGFFISLDGTVKARLGSTYKSIGHLYVASFDHATKFTKVGNFLRTDVKPKLLSPGNGVAGLLRTTEQAGFSVTSTGRPFDLVIVGKGFFKVLIPNGTIAYTRDGQFHLDPTGLLVNQSGYPLEPQITIPEGSRQASIGLDGTVEALISGSSVPTKIERIQIVNFDNPAFLKLAPQGLLLSTESSGAPIQATPGIGETGYIYSGYILGSHKDWNETNSNGLTVRMKK